MMGRHSRRRPRPCPANLSGCPRSGVVGPNGASKADNGFMSTAFWILVAVLAVGTVVGGLLRMRAWLQRPVPPEVIEAAHRRDEEDD